MLRMLAVSPVAKSLGYVEEALNKWLKPKINAESWDNVGLLVGSGIYPKDKKPVSTILLCNDLSLEVMNEAIGESVNLIIAYHPPIFVPLRSVGYNTIKESIIARCLAHDICVYSPHTALDSVHGGINDRVIWKLNGGPTNREASVIPRAGSSPLNGLQFICTTDDCRKLVNILNKNESVMYGFDFPDLGSGESQDIGGKTVVRAFHELPISEVKFDGEPLDLTLFPNVNVTQAHPYYPGSGRSFCLRSPKLLDTFLAETKGLFKVDYMQVGFGGKKDVEKVAFCAGSGASVLKEAEADLVLTGEMSHHEILDCLARGVTCVLVGHCNSERHYLPTLAKILKVLLNVPSILISKTDSSPLYVYRP